MERGRAPPQSNGWGSDRLSDRILRPPYDRFKRFANRCQRQGAERRDALTVNYSLLLVFLLAVGFDEAEQAVRLVSNAGGEEQLVTASIIRSASAELQSP